MKNLYLIICVLLLVSCKGNVPESQIVAQVGNSILTVSELRMQTPMGLTGTDSAAFVNEYIDGWIDQHIMYEQGMRNLPDIDQLNAQAENYRHNLIAQSYENELLKVRANMLSAIIVLAIMILPTVFQAAEARSSDYPGCLCQAAAEHVEA